MCADDNFPITVIWISVAGNLWTYTDRKNDRGGEDCDILIWCPTGGQSEGGLSVKRSTGNMSYLSENDAYLTRATYLDQTRSS